MDPWLLGRSNSRVRGAEEATTTERWRSGRRTLEVVVKGKECLGFAEKGWKDEDLRRDMVLRKPRRKTE